jgi:hypothetical protein
LFADLGDAGKVVLLARAWQTAKIYSNRNHESTQKLAKFVAANCPTESRNAGKANCCKRPFHKFAPSVRPFAILKRDFERKGDVTSVIAGTRLDLILCAHRLIPLGSSFQHQGA